VIDMPELYHCSDCGQDVAALEGLPGGLRCSHCKSHRIIPLVLEAEPVWFLKPLPAVEVVSTPTINPVIENPRVPAPKTRKSRKKAA
jgi:DNA-directed RNA polymerase subunit RPC12/RpoP